MKILRFLDERFEETLIIVLICCMTIIMGMQILFRLAGFSIRWAEEVCRYLFVWCGGLGISYATSKGVHLRLDVIPTAIPALKKPYDILTDIALLLVSIYMLFPGFTVLKTLFRTGQTSAAMQLPMGYVYLAFFIGFALTILRIAEKYLKLLAGRKGAAKA